MPMSLKCMIGKWLHKGQISQEEYYAVIKKLEGHDKQVWNDAINSELMNDVYMRRTKHVYQEGINKGRADVLNQVSAKMEEIISDKCAEYGVGCIEAYCDACGEFEDWIKEQLKGAE